MDWMTCTAIDLSGEPSLQYMCAENNGKAELIKSTSIIKGSRLGRRITIRSPRSRKNVSDLPREIEDDVDSNNVPNNPAEAYDAIDQTSDETKEELNVIENGTSTGISDLAKQIEDDVNRSIVINDPVEDTYGMIKTANGWYYRTYDAINQTSDETEKELNVIENGPSTDLAKQMEDDVSRSNVINDPVEDTKELIKTAYGIKGVCDENVKAYDEINQTSDETKEELTVIENCTSTDLAKQMEDDVSRSNVINDPVEDTNKIIKTAYGITRVCNENVQAYDAIDQTSDETKEELNVIENGTSIDVPDLAKQIEDDIDKRNVINDPGEDYNAINQISDETEEILDVIEKGTSTGRCYNSWINVKNLLNCIFLRQWILMYCGYALIAGCNSTEHTLEMKYQPELIILNDWVRITCSNDVPIHQQQPYTWSKTCGDGRKQTIALNNRPKNETSQKYMLNLNNGNRTMELDIPHFGKSDFCNYICEIGLHMNTCLNLTSKAQYMSFPQYFQPAFNLKGHTLEVTLVLYEVYPQPSAILTIEKMTSMTLQISAIKQTDLFYTVWMNASTSNLDCEDNEDFVYSIELELNGKKIKYIGISEQICSNYTMYTEGKNEGLNHILSPWCLSFLCLHFLVNMIG